MACVRVCTFWCKYELNTNKYMIDLVIVQKCLHNVNKSEMCEERKKENAL